MKNTLTAALLLATALYSSAQQANNGNGTGGPGSFSLGTRNTISVFNDDEGIGKGIGGQFRLQLTNRLNTEWYFDYITSRNGQYTFRNDYHIGWSVLLYTRSNHSFEKLLQPYLIAGHCFDYSKVMAQNDKANTASRLSMATQAGIGTHINITRKLDCSLSGQYMLHFGKELETNIDADQVFIERKPFTHPHGHLLVTISFNYLFADLW